MSAAGMSALDREIHDLLRFAAQRSILKHFRKLKASAIAFKGKDDPVTVVDKEVEEFLTDALTRLGEGVPVVGEEAAHMDAGVLDHLSGQCWIIDPLDGTANYAEGKTPFGVLIALADGGEAVAGWLYDPLADRLCHARKRGGAFINGERIEAKSTGETPPVAAISMLYLEPAEREWVARAIAPHYRLVEIPRCAAEQYPRLALGQNDLSTFKRTLPWDHAAGVLWLNEAGGKAARFDGRAYRVDDTHQQGLLGAASPALWEEFAERISDARA